MNGTLITLEGIDGSGKSTQAVRLAAYLEGLGREVVLVREPGDTPVSEALRQLVLEHGAAGLSPRTEAMLFSAARAQLVDEIIAPALERGALVLCDRFADSTIAYQGYGRELPLEEVIITQRLVTRGITPGMTLLLDLTVAEAQARRSADADDRMESAGEPFLQRVREGYLAMAAREPDRWRIVNGAGNEDDIAAEISKHTEAFLQT